jgi:hypothetical protein
MHYQELHSRYGTHVSQRVQRELTAAEFETVDIAVLPNWLENRAESAHNAYRNLLNNPTVSAASSTSEACRRWREAEDLAYLVVIAEDVGANARVL